MYILGIFFCHQFDELILCNIFIFYILMLLVLTMMHFILRNKHKLIIQGEYITIFRIQSVSLEAFIDKK